MKKKQYVGIRAKALLAVVLLVLVPSLFLASVAIYVRHESSDSVEITTLSALDSMAGEYLEKLNKNATACIDNYLNGIEMEGRSASKLVDEYMGKAVKNRSSIGWGSRNLLEQVNKTMVRGIMNGSYHSQLYDKLVNESGKEKVDAALKYFLNPPQMNYSTAHVNESAYSAINSLMANKSHLLYDFLYSILLPEYREELDEIMPVGEMLYNFRESKDILWSYFASPDGFIVLIPSKSGFSPLFNPLVRDWYVAAKNKGTGTWSSEYIDEITKMPMVTFSVPVYRKGTLIGVLGFDLLLSTLSEKAEQFSSGGKGFAFAMSEDGTALTYPDEGMIGKSLINGSEEFNHSMRLALNSSSGAFHSFLNGEKVFIAYSTIKGTGWKFVNVAYCSDIMEKAKESAHSVGSVIDKGGMYLISIIVAVGLIAFISTFFLINSVVKDIEDLTKVANEVSRGNFDVEVKVDAKDELGELQKSIKRMLNSIKIAMEELEEGDKRRR